MRRYLPTLVILFVVLMVGGSMIYSMNQSTLAVSGLPLFFQKVRGYYVPTFAADAEGQTLSLIFLGSTVGAVVATLALGGGLAFAFNWITRQPLPAGEAAKAAEKAKPGAAPQILLSDNRSLLIFWVVIIVGGIAFMVFRYWGKPIGTVPGINQLMEMKVLRLPGDKIEGLPSFIAGPGDEVNGLQLTIGVLVNALVGTAVTGFVLAWLFRAMDHSLKQGDKLPKTFLDIVTADVVEVVERRKPVDALLPATRVDRTLLLVNGLLVVLTLVFVGAWFASGQTLPTPVAESGSGGGSGGNAVETLKTDFAALPAGNAETGLADFSAAGCVACHSLDADVRIVGPSLFGVATRAETRRPGYSAEIYLYESILQPSAYLVESFQDGVMPKNFNEVLTAQQKADLIAFLLTKK